VSQLPANPGAGGEVITFYSYKGGTGRSMLLANVAWMLASAGLKILIIDWDLEAPGLHRYFKPFLGDDPELREQEGVIEWLQDYWDAMLDHEGNVDVDAIVREYADPRRYVRRLHTEGYLEGGIDLLGPGRQEQGYAEALADFDFTRLYQKLRGADFIEASKRILIGSGGYDYVLVDSRTGVSDTSGFCTVGLADTLVVCFTYNNQSVIGASNIARDIKRQAEALRAPRPGA
jgi:MinD-like ATPase involved in chromosome partitioning or flagellar assembly